MRERKGGESRETCPWGSPSEVRAHGDETAWPPNPGGQHPGKPRADDEKHVRVLNQAGTGTGILAL